MHACNVTLVTTACLCKCLHTGLVGEFDIDCGGVPFLQVFKSAQNSGQIPYHLNYGALFHLFTAIFDSIEYGTFRVGTRRPTHII